MSVNTKKGREELKGKIITFSPHRRRGMVMVQVKGKEGKLEFQHLQFSDKNYDSSIETHLYTDQIVDVKLNQVKPGKFVVDRIEYDIGRHLYKQRGPSYSQSRSSERRQNQRKGSFRKKGKPSNYKQTKFRDNKKSPSEQSRGPYKGPRQKDQRRKTTPQSQRDRSRYQKPEPSHDQERGRGRRKDFHKRRYKKGYNRDKRRRSKYKIRERMRRLAIYLHYRRIQQRKKLLLFKKQLSRQLRYKQLRITR